MPAADLHRPGHRHPDPQQPAGTTVVHPSGYDDLVHLDIKKLGRIPDGGGHKVLGRQTGRRDRRSGMGYWYIHNALDDHTRLAYSELLTDERKETAAAFWRRAEAYFSAAGITVARVMTDNGPCSGRRTTHPDPTHCFQHRVI